MNARTTCLAPSDGSFHVDRVGANAKDRSFKARNRGAMTQLRADGTRLPQKGR